RMFGEAAQRYPASPALRRGRLELTYGELDLASDRVGAALREQGAGQGRPVAILCEQPEDVICGVLGALKAGAVFVPLDPRTPERRLQAMLDAVVPAAFVVGEGPAADLAAALAAPGGGPPVLRMQGGVLADAADPNGAGPRELQELGPDDPCYLYFTSGSTGQPKAITGRFKSIAHFIRWEIEALGVAAGWRVSQLINPSFDAFLRDVFVPLCAGGTVCIPPDRETIADARRFVAWLAEEGIQLVHCVPSFFRTLLHGEPGPLPSLRYVLMSGEPLLPADVKRWQERQGTSTRLVNLYGPSETTMTKLVYFVEPADGDRRTIPIGKPMPGARALVLDPHGKVCPPRAVGEIYIRTPYRSLGYYGRPDLTAEVFVRNPFTNDPDDLVYRTGDLGRVLEDGNLEFLGRKDGQVKIRGVRIELAEIENLLLSNPRVRETVVVDLANPDGTRFLCAYVVVDGQPDKAPTDGLRDFLAESLPEHSLPSVFVALDELPRTLSGKVDRRALPSPERAREASDQELEQPRSATEEIVAGLFAQVLGLGRIGIHERFFEIGGHSLLATKVLARVRSAFDVEVPLRALFAHPTVAGLAQEVEEALRRPGRGGAAEAPTISSFRHDRGSPPPLSFAQERYWAGRHLEARTVASTVPLLMHLAGPFDRVLLRRALAALIDRHELLRTSFREGPAGPFQVIHAAVAVACREVDLARLPAAERMAAVQRFSILDGRLPFDYEQAPLLRVTLFRCAAEEHLLLFTIHHVAADWWSVSILFREVSALYAAFRAGRPSPLPPPVAQFQDFARWQRRLSREEEQASQVTFWREHLRGAVPIDLANFNGGRPRPGQRTFAAGIEGVLVPAELERQLEAFAAQHGVTLFVTLLSAFKALLLDETGQDDLVVPCSFANRNQLETESLAGNLATGLPLRTRLSGVGTFRELLLRVRDVTLLAHDHPDIFWEPVVEGMSFLEEGDRGGLTTFRVLFQFVKQPAEAKVASDLHVKLLPVDTGKIRLDLSLFLSQTERLDGRFRYNRDVLDPARVLGMRDRFLRLLAGIVADPERPLAELLAAPSRAPIPPAPALAPAGEPETVSR
ncbi:MAG TPA: amino acid adenylation domain-containing protein, partial [Thermoanaerobaculia bacterium]|nr:amino acid adenylation domain-containing protein [Thermoanaerobaculia bacterium]